MILHGNRLRLVLLAGALLSVAVVASPAVQAATFIIINNDSAGEGFNDTTAAAPVGGNTGTTIGAQRLIAFQAAANIWGALLSSSVPIQVGAQFNPLSCDAHSAVLGSAGAAGNFRDFTGAPHDGTWYAGALANSLRGSDNDPGGDDISAEFSSTIGTPGCLENSGWYYGLDSNPSGGLIDFVSVLVHELGHGLGFQTLVELSTGEKALGFNDTFMLNLEDHGASPPDYPSMTDAQRIAASIDTGNLHWTGAHVRAASGVLTAGKVGDHVRMFAPNPQQPGSSVSHWDTALTPDQIMEPSYTGAHHNPVLELPLFQDIGWVLLTGTPSHAAHDFNGDHVSDILWHHSNGSVSTWQMAANGTHTAFSFGTVNTAWQIAGTNSLVASTGDVDGGGKSDIFWRHTNGSLSLWEMNGGTSHTPINLGTVINAWQIAGVGDFDGDGHADILWRHTNGSVSIWKMAANGTHTALNLGVVATAWQVAGIGNVTGDGKADIVWRNTNGSLLIWQMNGGTSHTVLNLGTVATAWQIVGVGDFDGDGKADLFWRNSNGSVSIWKMAANGSHTAFSLGTVATAWNIVSIGDYNNDTRADILWRHTNGAASIWTMNANGTHTAVNLGTVATAWTVVE